MTGAPAELGGTLKDRRVERGILERRVWEPGVSLEGRAFKPGSPLEDRTVEAGRTLEGGVPKVGQALKDHAAEVGSLQRGEFAGCFVQHDPVVVAWGYGQDLLE
jgi:hypothetical protein